MPITKSFIQEIIDKTALPEGYKATIAEASWGHWLAVTYHDPKKNPQDRAAITVTDEGDIKLFDFSETVEDPIISLTIADPNSFQISLEFLTNVIRKNQPTLSDPGYTLTIGVRNPDRVLPKLQWHR